MFTVKYFPNNQVAEITAPTLSGFKELCEFVGHSVVTRKRSLEDVKDDDEVVVVVQGDNATFAKNDEPEQQQKESSSPILVAQPRIKRKSSHIDEDTGFFGDVTTFFSDIVVHGQLKKPVCLKNLFFPHDDSESIFEEVMLKLGSQFFEFGFKVKKHGLDELQWETEEDYENALAHLADTDFGNGGMLIIPSVFHSMFVHEFRKDLYDTIVEECRKIKVSEESIGKAICGGFANIFVQNGKSIPLNNPATNVHLNRKGVKGRRLFGWVNLGPFSAKQTFTNNDVIETIEVPVGHAIFYDESHRPSMPGKTTEAGMFNVRLYFNFFILHEILSKTDNLGCKNTDAMDFADMPVMDWQAKDGKLKHVMMSYPCLGASLKDLGDAVKDVYPGLYKEELTESDKFSPKARDWNSSYYNRFMCPIYEGDRKANGYFNATYFNNEHL
jgi:hypothetical protein